MELPIVVAPKVEEDTDNEVAGDSDEEGPGDVDDEGQVSVWV